MGSGDLIQRGWKGLPSFCVAWCRVFKVMYMFQMSQEIVSNWIKLFRSTYSNIVFSHYAAKIYIEFEIAAVRLRTQSCLCVVGCLLGEYDTTEAMSQDSAEAFLFFALPE